MPYNAVHMAKPESLYIACTFITHDELFVNFPGRERVAREESSVWESHAVPAMALARVERLPPQCRGCTSGMVSRWG